MVIVHLLDYSDVFEAVLFFNWQKSYCYPIHGVLFNHWSCWEQYGRRGELEDQNGVFDSGRFAELAS